MTQAEVDVSVIIPIYNQSEKLIKCIKGFQKQEFKTDIVWELIIADDGSDEKVQSDKLIMSLVDGFENSVKVITSDHCGRAKIRNIATRLARGKVLVFCDGDRVPCKEYIQRHFDIINKREKVVSIGNPKDFWGKDFLFNERVEKYARNTNYYNCISSIYSESYGENILTTSSNLSWLSLLIGNVAIRKSELENVGGFDEDFKSWGFEHFELGYRLQTQGYCFCLNPFAVNYHLVHNHNTEEVQNGFQISINIISKKHRKINIGALKDFFAGTITIYEYQKLVNDISIVKTNRKIINSPWKERE